MQKQFLHISEIRLDITESITFSVAKITPVNKGWVVKLKDAGNFEGREGMIRAFDIAAQTTEFVSGYKDEETELWDVVFIFESEAEATECGKVNEQMSIYQIETGRLKWII